MLSHSGRLSRFLTFVVHEALKGDGGQLKEYLIGLAVFDKDESFDPRLDPIVRVEAGRLRAKLTRYYETDGWQDPLIIEFLRGSYAPVFREPDSERPAAPVEQKALAVLPFADQTPAKDQENFCDGLSIELINAITKVDGIRVTAWSSVRQLKRREYDVREIGRRLRVGAAIEGSVRREGDRLRIAVQFVDLPSGCYVWMETYDRNLNDVFEIQVEVAAAVAGALKEYLARTGDRSSPAAPALSSPAYRLYLRGRHSWNKRSQEGLWDGLKYFERALEIDPTYALAHAGVADSYSLLGNYGVLPTHTVRAKAKDSAVKAVELGPTLAESHTSLGHVTATYDWDWASAEREFELAIDLKEYYPTAHHWYAINCLMPLRRLDEAALEIERAQALDPVSVSIARDAGVVYYCRREFDRAIVQASRTLELDPSFYEGYWLLGVACQQLGRLAEASEAFLKGVGLSRAPRLIGALGHCYAAMGKQREASDSVRKLATMSQRRYVSPFDTALVYMGLGEKDDAFKWLHMALAQRCYELGSLKVDPRCDILRADPRWFSVINAVGLEGEQTTGADPD